MSMIGVQRHVPIQRQRDLSESTLMPHPDVPGALIHKTAARVKS